MPLGHILPFRTETLTTTQNAITQYILRPLLNNELNAQENASSRIAFRPQILSLSSQFLI
jgi:hypothetical protein